MIVLRTGILYSIIVCAFIAIGSLYPVFLISLKKELSDKDRTLSAFFTLFGLYWLTYLLSNIFGWFNIPAVYKSLSFILNFLLFLLPVPLFSYFVRNAYFIGLYVLTGLIFYGVALGSMWDLTTIGFWGVHAGVDLPARYVFWLGLMLPLAALSAVKVFGELRERSRAHFVESIALVFALLETFNIYLTVVSWRMLFLRLFYILMGFTTYFYLSGENTTAEYASKYFAWTDNLKSFLRRTRVPFFAKLLALFILLSVIPITVAGLLLFLTFREIVDLYIYKPLLWNLKTSKEEFLIALGNVQMQSLFLIFLTIILVIFASSIASRAISQSLKRIGFGMKHIEDGDLGYKVEIESNDEVGDLANYFNRMASEIKRSREIMENWNKELEETVAERTRILQSLYDLSTAMGSTLEIDALLSKVVALLPPIGGAGCYAIFLVKDDGSYEARASKGCSEMPPFRSGAGLLGKAVEAPQAVKVVDLNSASRADLETFAPANIKTLLLAPIENKGKKVGLLLIGTNAAYSPTDIELNLVSTIAGQMAIAIDNANIFEKEKEAVKRLMDLDKMKTELISMVSHELRTPITSIKGFLAHFIEGTTGTVNEKQLKFLNIMSNEGDHLLSLVDNLLEFSRIDREGLKIKKEKQKIDTVIKNVLESIRPQLENRKIKLILRLSDKDASFLGDEMKIGEVIKNLMGNAMKFTRESPEIEVSTAVIPERTIEVRIGDNGIGISADHLKGLFQKFHQVDSSFTRKVGGLGLGLAISKEIVEAHGGRISAESEGEGKGSTFIFTLPMIG